jgi:hypothetical protein
MLLAGVVLVATTCFAVTTATAASQTSGSPPHVTAIWLKAATAYTPKAPPGATDDYHCTVLNPHVTRTSYIISSQFFAGSAEDHHAALYLVPPSLAPLANQGNLMASGWPCFGEGALPNAPFVDFRKVPTLTTWTPGHGADDLPKGTGIAFPAGSLLVMQVHYNLLVGNKPVKNSLVLHTVPTSTPLLPLNVDTLLAPPDVPCPTGVTGPLCTRAASLANQGQRFGQNAVDTVNGIELLCGHNPSDPPTGNSASCTSSMDKNGYIVRMQPHMHLLGVGFTMVLNPGTPEAKTVINVPNYDFHHQRAYNLATPIPVTAGELAKITCTYDPTLAQELPILRKAPSHFVTWGDGSTDEMCVNVVWTSAKLPDSHSAA